jgi:hypothetical protein
MPLNEAAAGGLLAKFLPTLGATALGACVMAMFDPPRTRAEVFQHAISAGAGWWLFGDLGHRACIRVVGMVLDNVPPEQLLLPSHFLVGCLAWAVFGAASRFRRLLNERGGARAANLAGLQKEE